MPDNQQIIVEHIVNIDTTAENIASVNAVAALAVQVAALAGMLPDVAASVQLRAELLAVSRNLGKIGRVSDALPLLETLPALMDNITAVIGARAEISAVVAQLHAITAVADGLDILLTAPEHAEAAKTAAEAARTAIAETSTNAERARTAQLNAETAETSANASAVSADGHRSAAAESAAQARQAADAAAAVSGLPDASAADPGDPLIWTGDAFGMGGLDETLTSRSGALGLSDGTLASIAEAKNLAEGVDAKASQAQTDALAAKTLAEGVDAKATQAVADAAAAKTTADAAGSSVNTFSTRLEAAEAETGRVAVTIGQHTQSGEIHTPFDTIAARITEAVSGAIAQIRDGGAGTLPEYADTLQKLANLLDDLRAGLGAFLEGTNADQRMGMVMAIAKAQEDITTLLGNALTRMDVVNDLYSDAVTAPLSAAQGAALREQVENAAIRASGAAQPWIRTMETVPEAWPYGFRSEGLLLVRPTSDGAEGADVNIAEWYIFDRNKPAKLVTQAIQVRMTDGTTVQTAVGLAVAASAEAKALAQGVDAKASQAQSTAGEAKTDAAAAKTDALTAKTLAEGVDAKATTAQTTAEAAAVKADEALSKTPELATQTTPGIVKGSDTVEIGADGAVNVVGGAGATVVSAPGVTMPPQVGIGFTFEIQLAAGPVLLPGASVAKFVLTFSGGSATGEPVDVPAANGAATYSHTPQGAEGDILTVKAVAVDSMGNASIETVVRTNLSGEGILRPAMTVLTGILYPNKVTFSTSDFTVFGASDTHTASQYRVRSEDNTVIYDSAETAHLTTHVAIVQGLVAGQSYFLDARHKGEILGWSGWSDAFVLRVPTDLHGLRIVGGIAIGDKSNGGMPFTQQEEGPEKGKKYFIVVCPASRRTFDTYYAATPPVQGIGWNSGNDKVDNAGNPPISDPQTSQYNTDKIMATVGGAGAPGVFARQEFEGMTHDVPNVQDMSRVLVNRELIDSVDETVAAYPTYSLRNWSGKPHEQMSFHTSSKSVELMYKVNHLSGRAGSEVFVTQGWADLHLGLVPIKRLYMEV